MGGLGYSMNRVSCMVFMSDWSMLFVAMAGIEDSLYSGLLACMTLYHSSCPHFCPYLASPAETAKCRETVTLR
jgi:hypothetical protein